MPSNKMKYRFRQTMRAASTLKGQPGVRSRTGATTLEFTLLGIPGLLLCMSVMMTGIDMWQFFTLSYSVAETTRFAAVHGITCAPTVPVKNSCLITRAQVAAYFESQALALNKASTVLTLTDGSGTITCDPVTSCPSDTSNFPATTNNAVGSNISITATYPISNPLFMYWPGAGTVNPGTYTVGATSTQEILY
jgi:Flp pilus assembly protein TadG